MNARPPDAAGYWMERARSVEGLAAVLPDTRFVPYHAWATGLLQRWTLSRLDRPRFRRCADLGCGRGEWTTALAPRCDEVFACDVADGFVDQTRERLGTLGHEAWTVVRSDLRSYRMPTGLDLAYIGAVLMYLDDREVQDVLYRLRQATVSNALVIVRDYCTFNLGRPARGNGLSYHRRPGDLVALARSAGLRCIEVRSSPSIYAEVMGNAITRWPIYAAWRLATMHWLRASHTFVFRA